MSYQLLRNGRWIGPYTLEQLQRMYQQDSLTLEDYVRHESTQAHVQIKSITAIADSKTIHPSFVFLPILSAIELERLYLSNINNSKIEIKNDVNERSL
jgi:hypothetical protein